MLTSHADLARRLDALEKSYDAQFKAVFDAIRELMSPTVPRRRRAIGFQPEKS
jgi:DnaJ-domain-containing protein 1